MEAHDLRCVYMGIHRNERSWAVVKLLMDIKGCMVNGYIGTEEQELAAGIFDNAAAIQGLVYKVEEVDL